MAWKKLGMVFDLKQHNIGWLKSHAMLPTPLLLDDRIRVYFTGRDVNGHSRISFVDLKKKNIFHRSCMFMTGRFWKWVNLELLTIVVHWEHAQSEK